MRANTEALKEGSQLLLERLRFELRDVSSTLICDMSCTSLALMKTGL
jgi:hypothetical protein